MANSEEINGIAFPAADAEKELNPGKNKDFEVDSRSSEVATSVKDKEQANAAAKKKHKEKEKKKDAIEALKSTIIISGIIVALAGAVFAITKKLKEK